MLQLLTIRQKKKILVTSSVKNEFSGFKNGAIGFERKPDKPFQTTHKINVSFGRTKLSQSSITCKSHFAMTASSNKVQLQCREHGCQDVSLTDHSPFTKRERTKTKTARNDR